MLHFCTENEKTSLFWEVLCGAGLGVRYAVAFLPASFKPHMWSSITTTQRTADRIARTVARAEHPAKPFSRGRTVAS
jgi:hypothetical protein